MNERKRGFTLIEMMLVLAIIALLMMILLPEATAIANAAKRTETQNRIIMLDEAVRSYAKVYGSHPPTVVQTYGTVGGVDDGADGHYPGSTTTVPAYLFGEPFTGAGTTFTFNPPFGGKLLVYFLMGPTGAGWHRPTSSSTTDPNWRLRTISAEWDPPAAITKFLDSSNITNGDGGMAYPCFVDAFGFQLNNGGLIGYAAAVPHASNDLLRFCASSRMSTCAMGQAYAADCGWIGPAFPPDNPTAITKSFATNIYPYVASGGGECHLVRVLAQCPYEYMIISPGMDGKFGWQTSGVPFQGTIYKGYWPDWDNGQCDDVANFPIK